MLTRIFLLLMVLLVPLASCSKKEVGPKQKPTVLVSVAPYAHFVNKIAQGAVEVQTLVPEGANPHLFEATPRQVQRYLNAELWIYLGEAFDKKALPFFREAKRNIAIVDVARGIDLISHEEHYACDHDHSHCEGADLHIWLSPTLAKQQAEHIAEGLCALLPEEKEKFRANLAVFLAELDELNERIATLLAPKQGQTILVSHPAFAYFCRDYHIEQLSIEFEGKDPLPQHITEILAHAKSHPIHSVLTEPQYSNKGAELIAQSLGLPTHSVDPYAENYSENLLNIAKVIAE